MSRTYRRTHKGKKARWLPNIWKSEEWLALKWNDPEFMAKSAAIHRRADWFQPNLGKNPSHWNHDFHTKPRRAKERDMISKIKCGHLDPDDVLWPDGKKPTIYYW